MPSAWTARCRVFCASSCSSPYSFLLQCIIFVCFRIFMYKRYHCDPHLSSINMHNQAAFFSLFLWINRCFTVQSHILSNTGLFFCNFIHSSLFPCLCRHAGIKNAAGADTAPAHGAPAAHPVTWAWAPQIPAGPCSRGQSHTSQKSIPDCPPH